MKVVLKHDSRTIARWSDVNGTVEGPDMPIRLTPPERSRAKQLAQERGVDPVDKEVLIPSDGPYYMLAVFIEYDRGSRVSAEMSDGDSTTEYAFEESKVKRGAEGTAEGGQFAEQEGVGTAVAEKPKKPRRTLEEVARGVAAKPARAGEKAVEVAGEKISAATQKVVAGVIKLRDKMEAPLIEAGYSPKAARAIAVTAAVLSGNPVTSVSRVIGLTLVGGPVGAAMVALPFGQAEAGGIYLGALLAKKGGRPVAKEIATNMAKTIIGKVKGIMGKGKAKAEAEYARENLTPEEAVAAVNSYVEGLSDKQIAVFSFAAAVARDDGASFAESLEIAMDTVADMAGPEAYDAEFEGKHPRTEGGEFGPKEGGNDGKERPVSEKPAEKPIKQQVDKLWKGAPSGVKRIIQNLGARDEEVPAYAILAIGLEAHPNAKDALQRLEDIGRNGKYLSEREEAYLAKSLFDKIPDRELRPDEKSWKDGMKSSAAQLVERIATDIFEHKGPGRPRSGFTGGDVALQALYESLPGEKERKEKEEKVREEEKTAAKAEEAGETAAKAEEVAAKSEAVKELLAYPESEREGKAWDIAQKHGLDFSALLDAAEEEA